MTDRQSDPAVLVRSNLEPINGSDSDSSDSQPSSRRNSSTTRLPRRAFGLSRYFTDCLPEKKDAVNVEPLNRNVRVEPKTYFANERTLLQWLNLCIFLAIGSFALIQLSAPGAGWVGGTVLVISIIFSLYSLGVFHYRRYAISHTSATGHYDDKFGPSLLVLVIILYLIGTLVFQIIIPPGLPTGVIPVTRDYRITLDSAFLVKAADLYAALPLLHQAVLDTLGDSGYSFSGSPTHLVSQQTETFYDSTGESACILYNNGFYLYQIEDLAGGTAIRTVLEKHTGDVHFYYPVHLNTAQELDVSSVHNATQYISPPLVFEHSRSKSLSRISVTADLPRLQSVASAFSTLSLWDTIKTTHWAAELIPVNNLQLRASVYGGMQMSFDNIHKGQLRYLTWEVVEPGKPGRVIFAQVSLTYPTTSVGTISSSELIRLTQFYKLLSALVYRDPVERMIADVVYSYLPFCP